jgi:hypothetical protein
VCWSLVLCNGASALYCRLSASAFCWYCVLRSEVVFSFMFKLGERSLSIKAGLCLLSKKKHSHHLPALSKMRAMFPYLLQVV